MSPVARAALILFAALPVLAPGSSRADSGLYLSWNDCRLNEEAVADFVFDCGTEKGFEELFCAFGVPLATGADVLGVIAVIDIQHQTSPLPDWWRLAKVGDCRSGLLSASADFPLKTSCVDPWLGQAVAEVQGYTVGEPRGGAGQARIKAVAGVIPALARTLDATSIYYGVKLQIQNTRSTGAGVCTGCLQGACLVLNSIEIERIEGAPGGDLVVTTPGPGGANWALWQGGTGAECTLVPVRNRTWGSVKSLYR